VFLGIDASIRERGQSSRLISHEKKIGTGRCDGCAGGSLWKVRDRNETAFVPRFAGFTPGRQERRTALCLWIYSSEANRANPARSSQ